MKKEVSNKIKILNFVFTVLIVLYHYIDINGYKIIYSSDLSEKIIRRIFWCFSHFGHLSMTFFFMVSAFLFYYNIDTSRQALEKIKKRIKTLLIPFLIWNIIVMLVVLLDRGSLPINSFADIIKILFFQPINGPMWYCLALFILILFSPIIIKFKKNNKTILILFFLIIIFCFLKKNGYVTPIFNVDLWWWKSNMIDYVPAFATGMLLGMLEPKFILQEKYNKKTLRIISFVLLIICIFIQYKKIDDLIFIIGILEVILIWFIVNGPTKINTIFYKVIGCSFFVYALHQRILIPIVNRISGYFFGNELIYWQYLFLKLIQVSLVVIISYFVYVVLKKILPEKIMFIFNGGRG